MFCLRNSMHRIIQALGFMGLEYTRYVQIRYNVFFISIRCHSTKTSKSRRCDYMGAIHLFFHSSLSCQEIFVSCRAFHYLKQTINIQNIKTITYLQKMWNLSLSELANKVLKGICQISFEVMYYWPLENLLYSLFRILYLHVIAFGFHRQVLVSSAFSGFLFILLCHNVYVVITNFCIIKDVKRVILNAVATYKKMWGFFLQKGNVVENRAYYSSSIPKCILATLGPRMIAEGR